MGWTEVIKSGRGVGLEWPLRSGTRAQTTMPFLNFFFGTRPRPTDGQNDANRSNLRRTNSEVAAICVPSRPCHRGQVLILHALHAQILHGYWIEYAV